MSNHKDVSKAFNHFAFRLATYLRAVSLSAQAALQVPAFFLDKFEPIYQFFARDRVVSTPSGRRESDAYLVRVKGLVLLLGAGIGNSDQTFCAVFWAECAREASHCWSGYRT